MSAENETTNRPWRARIRCWFGYHEEPTRTRGPFPYPDAYNCSGCGRLLYMIDEHTVVTINGKVRRGGIRYANLDQWLSERG